MTTVVVTIGKLRRPRTPPAEVCYDERFGIVVQGEQSPHDPVEAAAWIRSSGGWLRLAGHAKKSGVVPVQTFIRAWRKRT